jgi:penicillin-binding protein 1A
MAEVGYITSAQAKEAKSKPLKVNIRPFGTQIYAADYFAEEVRRRLVEMYHEDGLYGRAERTSIGDGRVNGGLSVRTTLDPNLQRMARRALIDGLVMFDRDKGWRGPLQKIETTGDWGVTLGGIEIPGDLQPGASASCSSRRRRRLSSACARPDSLTAAMWPIGKQVEIPFDEMKWAKTNKGSPKAGDGRAVRRRCGVGGPQEPGAADRRVDADAGA